MLVEDSQEAGPGVVDAFIDNVEGLQTGNSRRRKIQWW
jgi:hypothetical protein